LSCFVDGRRRRRRLVVDGDNKNNGRGAPKRRDTNWPHPTS
jgi:hypothetical protein